MTNAYDHMVSDLRARLDAANAEVQRLRDALTVWCCEQTGATDRHPADMDVGWSDRKVYVCERHLPEVVVSIALDHSYDRGRIGGYARATGARASPQHDLDYMLDKLCDAARAFFEAPEFLRMASMMTSSSPTRPINSRSSSWLRS